MAAVTALWVLVVAMPNVVLAHEAPWMFVGEIEEVQVMTAAHPPIKSWDIRPGDTCIIEDHDRVQRVGPMADGSMLVRLSRKFDGVGSGCRSGDTVKLDAALWDRITQRHEQTMEAIRNAVDVLSREGE